MSRLRWLLSGRSLFVLAIAFVVLVGYSSRIPRHVEPWPGHDREFDEGSLFCKAINDQFERVCHWNLPHRGKLCLMVYGISDEEKQNAVRDWAIAEKAERELTLDVTLEFYSGGPYESSPLLRTVEF